MALQQKEEIVWWGGRDISYGDRRYWDERYQAQRDSCMDLHGATPCPQGTGGEEAAEGPGPGHVPGGGEQQGGGAPHAAVSDPPEEFEFEWLCEYAAVRPLLRFLLRPDDGGSDAAAGGDAGCIVGREEEPGGDAPSEGGAGGQGSPAATAEPGAHSASPAPKEASMARLLASLRAGRAAEVQRAQQAQQQRAQQQAQQQRPEAVTETTAALCDRQLPCSDGGNGLIAASSAPATPIQGVSYSQ